MNHVEPFKFAACSCAQGKDDFCVVFYRRTHMYVSLLRAVSIKEKYYRIQQIWHYIAIIKIQKRNYLLEHVPLMPHMF